LADIAEAKNQLCEASFCGKREIAAVAAARHSGMTGRE